MTIFGDASERLRDLTFLRHVFEKLLLSLHHVYMLYPAQIFDPNRLYTPEPTEPSMGLRHAYLRWTSAEISHRHFPNVRARSGAELPRTFFGGAREVLREAPATSSSASPRRRHALATYATLALEHARVQSHTSLPPPCPQPPTPPRPHLARDLTHLRTLDQFLEIILSLNICYDAAAAHSFVSHHHPLLWEFGKPHWQCINSHLPFYRSSLPSPGFMPPTCWRVKENQAEGGRARGNWLGGARVHTRATYALLARSLHPMNRHAGRPLFACGTPDFFF